MPFVNRGDTDIAVILGGAGFFDKAHAAMDLDAQRGNFAARVGAVGFGKRSQKVDHFTRACFAQRGTVHIARCQIEKRPYGLGSGLHAQQHAAHIGMFDNRHRIA
jgi:hypothetical protein